MQNVTMSFEYFEIIQSYIAESQNSQFLSHLARTGPGFLIGGAPTLQEGGQYTNLPDFPKKNCIKFFKNWSIGEHAPEAPPPPPLGSATVLTSL